MTLLLSSVATGPGLGAAGQWPGAAARSSSGRWTDAVGELAARILAHGAPQGRLAIVVRNVSSLSDEDVAAIRRELRSELRRRGARLVSVKQASVEVQVTLSENVEGCVWVAEIQNGTSRDVAILSLPRPPRATAPFSAEGLSVRKVLLFERPEPMLDFAPLGVAASAPTGPSAPIPKALVISLDGVSLYRLAPGDGQGGQGSAAWQLQQSASFTPSRPWPRDARGRVAMVEGNSFDVFLPGMKCSGAIAPTLSLACHEGDEPWPIGAGGIARPPSASGPGPTAGTMLAHFAANRNFFDGRIRFGDGQAAREAKVGPFFSAAPIPSKSGTFWLLAGLDGRAQLLNAGAESVANIDGMGSDLVSLETGCQSGWQVLAGGSGRSDQPDVVEAYEIISRKAVATGSPVEFAGPVTALWPSPDGTAAIAVSHNLKTESYEAFRLSISCGR